MFPSRYWPNRYFAPRWWPKVGAAGAAVTVPWRIEQAACFLGGAEAATAFLGGAEEALVADL